MVDFGPNFDETEKEPLVLPVKVPNILINGAEGIAVGMATNIPPHNFGEVIEGVKAYMKNPDIRTEQIMEHIKGPDFPTGGIVVNQDDLLKIYEAGTGKLKIRGRIEVEHGKGGKDRIIITEIPYTMIGAGIGKFLNDVYGLVESKKTTDIVDISNQSSKDGIRIVIELKRGADIDRLCALLYKKTRLEDTFGVNMLAVADGRPETMGIVPMIRHHVNFQFEISTRKYKTLLNKELEKKEVQEGLIKACDVIDLIIEILRGSKNIKEAKACLVEGETAAIRFKSEKSKKAAAKLRFTERQATAILEMRLYKLIGLEIEALQKDYEATLKNILKYEKILGSRAEMAKVIIKELDALQKEYATPRRTSIENAGEIVLEEPQMEELDVVFLMDRFGYARTIDVSVYERNKEAADSENRYVISCKNTDKIGIFTNYGQMHLLKVADLPFGKFRDKGQPVDNVSNYDSSKEELVFLASLDQMKQQKMLFVSRMGMLKLVNGEEFDVAKRTTAATRLSDKDEVLRIGFWEEGMHLVMQSKKGMFLRIETEAVPEKKKGAVGVRGIRLAADDLLEEAYLMKSGEGIVIPLGEKELELNRLRVGKRDTKGVRHV